MAPRHEISTFIRQKQYIPDLQDDEPHLDPFDFASAYNNEVFNFQVPTLVVLDDELDDDETYSYTEDDQEDNESTQSDTQTEGEQQQSQQPFTPVPFGEQGPFEPSDLHLDLTSFLELGLSQASDSESSSNLSLCSTLKSTSFASSLLTTRFDLSTLILTCSLPPSSALISSYVSSEACLQCFEHSVQPEFPLFCVSIDDAGPRLIPIASNLPDADSNVQVMSNPASTSTVPVGSPPVNNDHHHNLTAVPSSSSGTLTTSSLPSLVPLDESPIADAPGFVLSASVGAGAANAANPNGWGAAAGSGSGVGGEPIGGPPHAAAAGGSGNGSGALARGSGASAAGGELALPRTVTRLVNSRNGALVYVVGTAHFSKESQEDVRATIAALEPQAVVLELCPARAGLLTLDEEELMRVAAALDTRRSLELIRRKGVVHGVFELMMLALSAHITRQIGMAPGGEFRAAFQQVCAMGQDRCRLVLGDRAVGLTLRRAFSSLSLWQKIRLFYALLMAKEPITKEDVEKMKERDLLESILRELGDSFPQLHRVLVEERDAVLAHNIWRASLQSTHRSPPTVIASSASASAFRAISALNAGSALSGAHATGTGTGLLEAPHPSATSPASLSAASSAGNFGSAQQPHAHFSACALTARGASGDAPAGSSDDADEPELAACRNQQLHISVGSQPYLLAAQKLANAAATGRAPEQLVGDEAADSQRASLGAACSSRDPGAHDVPQQRSGEQGGQRNVEHSSETESDAEDDVAEVEVSPAAGGMDEDTVAELARLVAQGRPAHERPPVVVAVVGMGHVSGIVAHWERMPYSITDYLKVPGAEPQARRSPVRRALRWAVPFAVLAVGVAIAAGFISLPTIPGV